jgi:hypothetical protein
LSDLNFGSGLRSGDCGLSRDGPLVAALAEFELGVNAAGNRPKTLLISCRRGRFWDQSLNEAYVVRLVSRAATKHARLDWQ